MADITQTLADVQLKSASPTTKVVQSGEILSQGKCVYKKSSDGKYYLCDVDGAGAPTTETATIAGVSLTPAAASGDYFVLMTAGSFDPGGTVTVGQEYVASDTVNGNIAPRSDLDTDDYISRLGVGTAADTIEIDIHNSGVTVP